MIRCFFMRRRLYEYADGGLPEEESVRVANHLEECPSCRAKERQIRDLLKQAARIPVPVPSDEFWKRFQTELDDKLNRRLVPGPVPALVLRRRLVPVMATAAICLIVLSVSFSRKGAEEAAMIEELSRLDGRDAEIMPLEELAETDFTLPA